MCCEGKPRIFFYLSEWWNRQTPESQKLVLRREGSSPSSDTNMFLWCNWKTRYLEVVDVAGSTPVKNTNMFASYNGSTRDS